MDGMIGRAADQLRQFAGLQNAYAPETGNTMLERLRFKKTSLELQLKKTTDDLGVVNDAIRKLEDDPKLESLLSVLGKANII